MELFQIFFTGFLLAGGMYILTIPTPGDSVSDVKLNGLFGWSTVAMAFFSIFALALGV